MAFTVAQVISAAAQNIDLGTADILDSASAVQGNLDALNAVASLGKVGSVTFTDQSATVTASLAQYTADQPIIGRFLGNYTVAISDPFTVDSVGQYATTQHVSLTVSDTVPHILAGLDALAGQSNIGLIAADGQVTVTAAQYVADQAAVDKIKANDIFVNGSLTVAQAQTLEDAIVFVGAPTIADTSENVAAFVMSEPARHIGIVGGRVIGGFIGFDYTFGPITLTDIPGLTVSYAVSVSPRGQTILNAIQGPYALELTGAPASAATTLANQPSQAGITIAIDVTDTAANIQFNIDALETLFLSHRLGTVTVTDSATPAFTPQQQLVDSGAIKAVVLPQNSSVTASAAVSAGTTQFSISVSDTAQNITANAAALDSLASSGKLAGVHLTGSHAIPVVGSFSAPNLLGKIEGGFTLAPIGVTASSALSETGTTSLSIIDSAAHVQAALDQLQGMVGKISTIGLSDPATGTLTITESQATADASVLSKITSGFNLNVVGPSTVSGAEYEASNPDLILAFGNNPASAAQHYASFGIHEGRATASFSAGEYEASNSDLVVAFHSNTQAALNHYLQFGFTEHRSTGSFNVLEYEASNPDLIQAYGANTGEALQHYLTWGFDELAHNDPNRRLDTFNAAEFEASNHSLITAFGTDLNAVTEYYITSGFASGLPTASFNAAQYLANYSDLRAAFGADTVAATLHFIGHGFAEGRTDAVL